MFLDTWCAKIINMIGQHHAWKATLYGMEICSKGGIGYVIRNSLVLITTMVLSEPSEYLHKTSFFSTKSAYCASDAKEIYHCSLITAEKSPLQGVFGGLGRVPRLNRLGDIVCIMHGSKTPVVLRRNDNESTDRTTLHWYPPLCGGVRAHGIIGPEP
jgi:hypothetical protein